MATMNEIALIRLGERYATARGVSLARVATLAAGDGKFFARLQSGQTCTLRTAGRVVRWLSERWPDGTEWPRDLERPV